jgi:hypothetical protein
MTEKELDLVQFSAIHMAEFCASSPEVVWSELFQLHPLRAPSDEIRGDIEIEAQLPGSRSAAARNNTR